MTTAGFISPRDETAVAEIVGNGKACTVNPLKSSPALGAALAFLGLDRAIPLFHGSQGCTAFALVLMVRHFREAIPLQTTAMNEISTILGGVDHVEEAIGNLFARARPQIIGLCSTALTETRGEDMAGDLKLIRERHPEWADLAVVSVSTPDYAGSIEAGWGAAAKEIVTTLVPPGAGKRTLRQVNLLPGSHLTPGDVEELRDLIEGFGLRTAVVPDLSRSLDGWVPPQHVPTSLGGASRTEIESLGRAVLTIAVGEHMRDAAEALQARTGVPYRLFRSATGLEAVDALVATLMEVSGRAPSERLKRDRSRLVDAMLDAHFPFNRAAVAIAAEPDLLLAISALVTGVGARIAAAVTTAKSPAAGLISAARVIIGDLDDLEQASQDADLILASSHAAPVARNLGRPLYRIGFPIVDRIGSAHAVSVGYGGSRRLLFALANVLLDHHGDDHPALADEAQHTPERETPTPESPERRMARHA
ncbi:MAG: nitrogenase iron-molybdenum cofactor biosynthesis protein NifN [Rhodospirillales bacterium]